MGLFSGLVSLVGAAGKLFGKKPKTPTPADNIWSQAAGARQAAEAFGYNPLTLLQYGQPGGSLAAGGVPPLASVEFLADAIAGIEREFNGDADRQRQADQLNLDLARIKLEQARSGVVVGPQTAAQSVGQGPSPLGRRAVTVFPTSVMPGAARETAGGNDTGNVPRVSSLHPDGAVPLEVPYTMPDGSSTMGPNPDGADLEQFAYTGAMKAKSMSERYAHWWMREAPPRYRSAHQAVTGKNPKTAIDAKRSAYGPQQKIWPF